MLAVPSNRTTLLRNAVYFYYSTTIVFLSSVLRLLVTTTVVPISPTLVNLIMEAKCSSKTSILTRTTQCNIPEDGILHSHRRENLKSYIALTGWAL
jgi:hypothetical protein